MAVSRPEFLGKRRHGDHGNAAQRQILANAAHHLEPVHPWHLNVREDEIRPEGPKQLEGVHPVRRGMDLKAFVPQNSASHAQIHRHVVDYQNGFAGHN